MNWKWEELTSPDFGEAVKAAEGVCVLPIGVVERHGTHLPLGTDYIVAHEIAVRAAEIEPAVVFPEYWLGQTQETKNWPGAIAIRHDLILALLDNLCEEIARNGCKKIIILNGHGGNEFILPTFMWTMLEKRHDFQLYLLRLGSYLHPLLNSEEWKAMMESEYDYHGGEMETSEVLAVRPELVRMGQMLPPAKSLNRLPDVPAMTTAVWWYADWPDQYAGDATHATAEKGEYVLSTLAKTVAEMVKAIKADTKTAQLEQEYFDSSQH